MKKFLCCCLMALGLVYNLSAGNVWKFYAKGNEENPFPGYDCIVKDNWALQLYGTGNQLTSHLPNGEAFIHALLAGSGELDLRQLEIEGYAIKKVFLGRKSDIAVFKGKTELTAIYADRLNSNYIPNHCFYGCTGLQKIDLKFDSSIESVSINQSAFAGSGITNTLFSIKKSDGSLMPISAVNKTAFESCIYLQKLPENVQDAPTHSTEAYSKCSGLREVAISNAVTLATGLFNRCSSITNLYLGGTYTYINGTGNNSFFQNLDSLQCLTLASPALTDLSSNPISATCKKYIIGARAIEKITSKLFNYATDIVFLGAPPPASIMYGTVVDKNQYSKTFTVYAPMRLDDKAWTKADFVSPLTDDERADAPEGAFGAFTLANGRRNGWVVNCSSPFYNPSRFMILLK